MSIQTQIERLKKNVSSAYSAVEEMGGAVPENANSDNLPNAIKSVRDGKLPAGGTMGQIITKTGSEDFEAGWADNPALELAQTKQDKLTGQPGQAVSFNADRSATAVQGWSNPNLLDNWYFPDPINQRGLTEYGGGAHGIDRWINSGTGKITLTENGILLGPSVLLDQRIEPELLHAGQVVTLSVLVGNMLYAHTKTLVDGDWGGTFALGSGLYARMLTQNGIYGICTISTPAEYTGTTPIRAVKLELGTVQTLAHQDAAGNWVLNDPPPNKALELLKCQRYLRPLLEPNHDYEISPEIPSNGNCILRFEFPSMRTAPALLTMANDGVRLVGNDGIVSIITNLSLYEPGCDAQRVSLALTFPSAIAGLTIYALDTFGRNTKLMLTAEL